MISRPLAPNSASARAIAYLSTLPAESRVTTAALHKAIGLRKGVGLLQAIEPAIIRNLVSVHRISERHTLVSLPEKRQPEDDESHVPLPVQQTTVSAAAVPSIFAYAEQRNAAPFSSALSSDGRCTLQRQGRVIAELTAAEFEVHIKWLVRTLGAEITA
jgi:hypothetical protein